jgi:hypothetical protein
MRGDDDQQEGMFSYTSPEKRVPTDHPLRNIVHHCDLIAADQERTECNTARQPNRPRARLQLASGVMVKATESGCIPGKRPFSIWSCPLFA